MEGNASTANTAISAGSATTDSSNNNIVNTYARIDKVYSDSGTYRQFLGKDGSSTDWIRTTESGIIPYTSGDSANGHSMLGTPSWYFSQAYIQNIYGYLNGNISGSSTSCSGNSATATKLQTARTIWGQSFDGSGNVSGAISNTGNITPSATKTSDLGSNTLSYRYVYTTWIGAPSSTALSFGAANKVHLTINTSGDVGIGTTSPTSKLHVAGTGYFTSDISSASNIIAGGYIKGETVKISSGCTLQYDSTQKCVKFVF